MFTLIKWARQQYFQQSVFCLHPVFYHIMLSGPQSFTLSKHKVFLFKQSIHRIAYLNDIELVQAADQHDYDNGRVILAQIMRQVSHPEDWLNRSNYYSHLTVYHNNCAFFHHMAGDFNKAWMSMGACIESYEYLQGFLETRQDNACFNIELAKLQLQNCALLSEDGRHEDAFRQAEKALSKLVQSFRVLKVLCDEGISHSYISPSSKLQAKKIDKICYKTIVLAEARSLLEDLCYLPPFHKLGAEEKCFFDKIMSHVYNWKDNTGVSIKTMRKELEIGDGKQTRSLLGIPKANKSLSSFNMGLLMSVSLKKMGSVCSFNKLVIMFPEKIKQMGLIASVCYFTAATEGRFSEIEEDMECLSIVEKYEKLFKNEQIHRSRILHLKAMQLSGKIAPEAEDYFSHLVESFNKNYKLVLDQIKEEPSMTSSFTGCEEASFEYGIDISLRNCSHKGTIQKKEGKSKISKVLRKYGMQG